MSPLSSSSFAVSLASSLSLSLLSPKHSTKKSGLWVLQSRKVILGELFVFW